MSRDEYRSTLNAARAGVDINEQEILAALRDSGDLSGVAYQQAFNASNEGIKQSLEAPFRKGLRHDGIRSPEDLRIRCWVDEETNCWLWRGATDANGRPSMRLPALGRTVSIGVACCYFETGGAPMRGQVWHVTCKTANCANPDHRRSGTRSTMMNALKLTRSPLTRARISAGKRAKGKLTEAQREEIALSTENLRVIGDRYGICPSYVSKIRIAQHRSVKSGSSVFNWRP